MTKLAPEWVRTGRPVGPTTFGSHRGCRWPEARPGPSVVAGTADLDGRGGDNTTERGLSDRRKSGFTTEGGGGRPAPEPQGSPRGVRAVPKNFPENRPRDSGSPIDILSNGHGGTNAGHPTSGTGPPAGGVHVNKSATVRRNN